MSGPAEAPPRGFPTAEFEARLERAQALMRTGGFDALLLTTEPEVRWFSGFHTLFWQSPTRPWFLVVPRAGRPAAVVPEIGAPVMARTWIDDIRSWPSPRPEDDGVGLLAEALRELAGPRGRVGLPMGPETVLRMPLADFRRLQASLPDVGWDDATALIRALRRIKSEREIAKIAHVCRIASDGFEALPQWVGEGQTLVEVFRGFRRDLIGRGADDVPYLVGAGAPGGYDDVISPPGERPLAAGDLLMMDTGATFDGYWCDFDRNLAIGRADAEAARAYGTLWRATEAGLAAARPGATCAAVFRAMQAVIEAAGCRAGNLGRMGHGLGMQLTEPPSNAAWDDTVLEPGMVLTLEPGLAFAPGRGQVHEENLVVREDGAELLSRRAPPELPVIGA